jgi:MFS family permease
MKRKKEFRKGEWSLLWPFYLTSLIDFCFTLIPIAFIIYFQYKGFELGLGAFLLAISCFSGFFFELPTGVFADVYGRKVSTLVHYFSMAFIGFLVPFAKTPLFLMVLFFLEGISITFRSGAKQAWIIERLKKNKREDLIQNYFTKNQSLLAIGAVVSGLIFSALFFLVPAKEELVLFGLNFIGLDLMWFIGAFIALLVGFLLLFVKEEFKKKKVKLKDNIKNSFKIAKEGLIYSWKHPVIFALLFSALLGTIFIGIRGVSFQPFLIQNAINVEHFGYLSSIIMVSAIFIPFIAQKISKNMRKNIYLALMEIVMFIFAFTILFIAGPILAFIYWFAFRSLMYFGMPVEMAYFQKHVPSKQRATIGSIQNLSYTLGGFIGLFIGGFALNLISPALYMFLGSFLLIPIIIIYLRIK